MPGRELQIAHHPRSNAGHSGPRLTYRQGVRCIFCGTLYDIPRDRESRELGRRMLCPKEECVSLHRGIYGSLEVTYDYEALRDEVDLKGLLSARGGSMWRFSPLLPVSKRASLGEGDTPLLASPRLNSELRLPHAFLKNEGMNPTGSFKDRESAVVVNRALEIGAAGVTCVSCGNAAASLSAYAAHAGLGSLVFTPTDVSIEKRKMIEYTGGRLVTVEGSLEDVWELVNRDPDLYLSVAGPLYARYYDANPALNPYRTEGDKTTAYEIFSELHYVPDWVVVPVGNGCNLAGIWKGFRELQELGLTSTAPRMLGVQILGADPVTEGWKQGLFHSVRVERPVDSIAEGIVAKDSYDAPRALRAVKDSSGAMASVTDGESLDEMFACARQEGLLIEPTSATVLAAGKEMRESGLIAPSDHVVFVLTGSGVKTIETLLQREVGDRVQELHAQVEAALGGERPSLR